MYCKIVFCDDAGVVRYIDECCSLETGVHPGDALVVGDANVEPDGSLLVCDKKIRLWRLELPFFTGYAGYYRDDKKYADLIEQLEKSNIELEGIFNSSHDGLVVADGTGLYIRVNDNYTSISGIPKDEVLGHTAMEIVEKGIISDSATVHILKTGKPISFRQTFKTGRQSVVTGTPVYDENGTIVRIVTNVRDMTEIRNLREKLVESRKKLSHYSQIVQNLTSEKLVIDDFVCKSNKLELILKAALKFAHSDAAILVTGESGVGKEKLVDYIHRNSRRKKAPFLKINCGAIPDALLESELFGYEGGAFTGAKQGGSEGLFELADGGTILLDEISELSLHLQVKLLRVVQQKEFYRVGGKKIIKVDVRIIAASNRDLADMVKQNLFRADLFYRLDVLKLNIPPLRERREDIIPLATHYLRIYNEKYQMNKYLASNTYQYLLEHDWMGNVRELENQMERLVLVSEGDEITADYLPDQIRNGKDGQARQFHQTMNYWEARDEFERRMLSDALGKYKTARGAAEKLGIDHSTIVKKATKFGIPLSR